MAMDPLLERDGELQAAGAAVRRARESCGGIVLVGGEAGIGKTALIAAIAAQAGADGLRVLRGGCEDLFAPRPLGALRDIAGLHFPALAGRMDGGATAATVFAAFLQLLATSRDCSLVIFEDLHWADEATLDLVRYLGRRIAPLPALLLLSYRDDELEGHQRLRQVLGDLPASQLTRLAPAPLSPAAVATLAQAAGRTGDGLHDLTGGNPFYVTEVLASGVTDPRAGVPTSVRDAVHTRLARLAPSQRAVLDALCVEPGRAELWLARALLGAGAEADIDACIARGVLVADDGVLSFRHELARRAVADALPPLQRRQRHAALLAALLSPPAGVAAPPLSRLVHHAGQAGDAARVLELAPRAAQQAAVLGAHREAAQQLAAALRHADQAPPEQRAELYESWSYESGLSQAIDERVIDARHQAIALWRQLGRLDKVGLNLRWLWRLHWYRGEAAIAEAYADQAVAILEPLPPCAELAWAYSLRSQMHMLRNRSAAAVEWGQRAIGLATQLGESEILCHALNNVGTAELLAGDDSGSAKLERSLAIALEHGFHEHAARVYTNAGELAVVWKQFERAERWLLEGIHFDRTHDLDAWTHYLVGWLAQLRLEQGRFDEADRIANEVLTLPQLTAVMRLPALTVLARLQVRRNDAAASATLAQALAVALPTAEVQRIAPLAATLAEACWLRADLPGCRAALDHLQGLTGVGADPWEAGEMAVWQRRSSAQPASTLAVDVQPGIPLPWRLELQGRAAAAADAWLALGAPNEAALALLQAALECGPAGAAPLLARGLALADQIGAAAAAARMRSLGRRWGLLKLLPGRKRGRYSAARSHPYGLSAREQQVLQALGQRQRNTDIAALLGVAERTVEHHVSAVLRKLDASDRVRAVDIALGQGLLAGREAVNS